MHNEWLLLDDVVIETVTLLQLFVRIVETSLEYVFSVRLSRIMRSKNGIKMSRRHTREYSTFAFGSLEHGLKWLSTICYRVQTENLFMHVPKVGINSGKFIATGK
jgi:hypothetical protein